ncbi:MAG TPA: 7-carboxy-7-deazaguanine synthase QueE [Bacteroidetes bacterium]|nr:MAG: 7-carboxy-7-deazaguanine synthase QueE [Bacteroidota bacterium]HHL57991.1 7-carboxy-7-deazaguanine synthase QueE [Bacteroidota bacterium]
MIDKSDKLFKGGMMLPIMEDFYTLQGEGYHMGKAAYFVRIGGCDVGCSWCDTKQSWNADLFPPVSVDDVVGRICAAPAKTVVVTGGEPSLYPLEYFTSSLRERNIKTMVETSGAYELTGDWDWICLSPKKNSPPLQEILKKANELKVIIQTPEDLIWAEENAAKVNPECLLYLQPEWKVSEQIMDVLTNYVMENTQWAVSLQAHKYMKIP